MEQRKRKSRPPVEIVKVIHMHSEIPLSRRRTCQHCATIIDSTGMGVHKLVQGWVPAYERKRGHSSNSVALSKDLNKYICETCYDKLKKGIPPGQMSLLEIDDD
jgi:RNase P subunit RPR2